MFIFVVEIKTNAMNATTDEVKASASGTRFTKVKCYNGEGELCALDWIPRDNNPDYDSDLSDAQEVSDGYFTETSHTIRK